MLKYGYKETAEWTLCNKKAHEESGSSWNRKLPKETIGHIQSAGCRGQNLLQHTMRASGELLQEVDGHGKADRHMKLLTIETESRLSTLWDQEQCTQFCRLEGRVVGSSERGRDENPVEGRECRAASIGRAVSRMFLAAETGWNWIGHSN